jgi:hypothetical protein
MSDCRWSLNWKIGLIERIQIVTTSNSIANSHILHFTTAHNKSSQFVFTSRFMVTDPNNFLCLRPYRLPNVSQLAKLRVVRLGGKPLETHDQFFLSIEILRSHVPEDGGSRFLRNVGFRLPNYTMLHPRGT